MVPPESWHDWVAEAVMAAGILIWIWLIWGISRSRRR
jgi:hypothetical protein